MFNSVQTAYPPPNCTWQQPNNSSTQRNNYSRTNPVPKPRPSKREAHVSGERLNTRVSLWNWTSQMMTWWLRLLWKICRIWSLWFDAYFFIYLILSYLKGWVWNWTRWFLVQCWFENIYFILKYLKNMFPIQGADFLS